MLVTDNKFSDLAVQEPNVTDAPAEIWLVYGDLERDTTHAECYRDGDVGWCDESQFPSDVRYVRADIADAAVAAALERRREYDDALVAAERKLCALVAEHQAAFNGLAAAPVCEHFEVTRMETYDTKELVAVWACVGCRRRFEPISVAPDNGGVQAHLAKRGLTNANKF